MAEIYWAGNVRPPDIWDPFTDQIWAYPNDFGKHGKGDYVAVADDGTKLTYKCHIVLKEEHFFTGPGKTPNDSTREIVAQFLRDNKFPHKTAPRPEKVKYGWDVFKEIDARKQYGKCFTIYYPTLQHFYDLVVGVKKLIEMYGLEGIPLEFFKEKDYNMQYEYPVPGTNNIVYYTLERVNGKYMGGTSKPRNGGYPRRKVEMNKYFGTGPLDFLFPKLNPSGEAFQ